MLRISPPRFSPSSRAGVRFDVLNELDVRTAGLGLTRKVAMKSMSRAAPVVERHKPPIALPRERRVLVALDHMTSNINVSTIARAASNCGLKKILTCGLSRLVRE
jgi:hypothetical protein